jgi:hypothetical protein
MKSIGGYMFFFGVGSIVLGYMGRELLVLSWVDNWGPTVGWGIRVGLIVVGAALWFLGRKDEGAAT